MSDSHTDMLSERQHNQFHSFVAPMNWRFLPQIVNQLDPISFINLASTCKSLHSYCFKSEEIKIKYPIHWMSVTTREGKLMFDLAKREYELNNDGGYDYRPVETDDKSRIFDSVENRKNLQDYPFVVRLNKLQIRDVIDTGFLASFRRFLNEYAVESIVEVDALGINDWDGFVQFLKDFHTQRVFVQTNPCYFGGIFVSGTPMPEEAAKCFLQNTVNFQSDASISDELILNTTMPYLCLPLASICRTTFIDLLKRLAHSTGNMEWTLGRDVGCLKMSQRLAPAPFACPGCKENFDFGIHSPYIGSCAHSLCSACVIEKKTTTCPVCQNPGGFLWKQTNVLATDLLTILAEKRARRLEMEENADNLIGVLFEPDNKNILTAIVNKLAPKDFVHLAMTCRKMKNFCFEEKGIRVNYDYLFVKADLRDPTFPYFGVSKVSNVPSDGSLNDDDLYPQHYTGIGGGFFDHSRNRKKLRQVPFVYKLDTLEIEGVLTSAGMVAIRSFLSEFPIEYVDEIHTNGITDWDGFTLFLKEFKPRIVEIYTEDEGDSSVPNMTAQYILQNTRKFTCDLSISEGLILCAPQNLIFDVRNASVSKDIFEGLVLKCSVSTGYINWLFGCQTCQFDKYKYFREVLPFDHKGPISKERPLAFVKENEPFHFFILRRDDKMIHCVKAVEGPACCVMLHPLEYPPCLQSNSQNAA